MAKLPLYDLLHINEPAHAIAFEDSVFPQSKIRLDFDQTLNDLQKQLTNNLTEPTVSMGVIETPFANLPESEKYAMLGIRNQLQVLQKVIHFKSEDQIDDHVYDHMMKSALQCNKFLKDKAKSICFRKLFPELGQESLIGGKLFPTSLLHQKPAPGTTEYHFEDVPNRILKNPKCDKAAAAMKTECTYNFEGEQCKEFQTKMKKVCALPRPHNFKKKDKMDFFDMKRRTLLGDIEMNILSVSYRDYVKSILNSIRLMNETGTDFVHQLKTKKILHMGLQSFQKLLNEGREISWYQEKKQPLNQNLMPVYFPDFRPPNQKALRYSLLYNVPLNAKFL